MPFSIATLESFRASYLIKEKDESKHSFGSPSNNMLGPRADYFQ
jgi:hypothetical protein